MRVIAGSLKGRRLKPPDWEGLRPTSDKLRETIFNILAPRIAGARVVDGYAGTGALGIEALSRGASTVTFIEQDTRAQALIAANLERCGVTNGYAIIRTDVARALASLRDTTPPGSFDPFDIVLLDPPYAVSAAFESVLAAAGEVLAPGGIVVLEHARRAPVPLRAGRLFRSREQPAGDSALAFYEVTT
ncbi:MAG: 16S rRNA (guanine(966)-N(2))-methyltransferase RsmD [Vicinamibacterales bacterium]